MDCFLLTYKLKIAYGILESSKLYHWILHVYHTVSGFEKAMQQVRARYADEGHKIAIKLKQARTFVMS